MGGLLPWLLSVKEILIIGVPNLYDQLAGWTDYSMRHWISVRLKDRHLSILKAVRTDPAGGLGFRVA